MPGTHPPVHLRTRGKLDEATERVALRAALTAAHLLGLATGTHLRNLRELVDPLRPAPGASRGGRAARAPRLGDRRNPGFAPREDPGEAPAVLLPGRAVPDPRDPTPPRLERSRDGARLPRLPQHHPQLGQGRRSERSHRGLLRQAAAPTPTRRRCRPLARPPHEPARLRRPGPRLPSPGSRRLEGLRPLGRTLPQGACRPSASSARRDEATLSPRRRPLRPPRLDDGRERGEAVPGAAALHGRRLRRLLPSPPRTRGLAEQTDREGHGQAPHTHRPALRPPPLRHHRSGRRVLPGGVRRAVRRLGAVQRFASTRILFATARLERFWRTLKESAGLYRLHLPLTCEDLEHRLEVALLHYLCFRPHEGLAGATPAEAFLGVAPAHPRAQEPPRGRPGEGPREAPFRVEYLDPVSRRFAILVPAA